ncbi:MAG: hypothetical protein ACREV3_11215, partial [Gammaproteobacteria bacterium]
PTVQSKPPCTRPMTLLTRSFNYLKLHENVAQLLSENENVRIYYYAVHRALKLVKMLPQLHNFACREITIIRNKLVEHAEATEPYSFGYGSTGPVVRPIHTPGREWIDPGLLVIRRRLSLH